jgi:hypothetical protein
MLVRWSFFFYFEYYNYGGKEIKRYNFLQIIYFYLFLKHTRVVTHIIIGANHIVVIPLHFIFQMQKNIPVLFEALIKRGLFLLVKYEK